MSVAGNFIEVKDRQSAEFAAASAFALPGISTWLEIQQRTMFFRTNEGAYVGCWKILYNRIVNENKKSVNEFIWNINVIEIMCALASAFVCDVKFVNSFARCQHVFVIAVKTPTTSILIFCRICSFMFQFRPK